MILVFKAPTRDAAWGMLIERGIRSEDIDTVKHDGTEWFVQLPDTYRPVAAGWFSESMGQAPYAMGTLLWFSGAAQ